MYSALRWTLFVLLYLFLSFSTLDTLCIIVLVSQFLHAGHPLFCCTCFSVSPRWTSFVFLYLFLSFSTLDTLYIAVLVSQFLPLRDMYTADKGRTREVELLERDANAYLSRLRAEKLAAASLAAPASDAALVTTERRQDLRWEGTTGRLRHLAKQKHRAHVHITHTHRTRWNSHTVQI